MRLLHLLFGGEPQPSATETTVDRERLESHLRSGARALSSQTPEGLRSRIMDEVHRDLESTGPRLPLPAKSRRTPLTLATSLAAAALLTFLYIRTDPHPEPILPDPAPVANLQRGLFGLIRPMVAPMIRPVLEAPEAVNTHLEQEAHNLLQDSQRLLVLVLPTKLSKPLEKF